MVYFKQFISDLITEVSYRTDSGIVNLENPDHISILSEVLDEIGLSDIKHELFKNLFEAERFSNPLLNREIEYTDAQGNKKTGLIGNLLRNPKESPGRQAAERQLPPEGSPEREKINQELGSEKDGKTDTPSTPSKGSEQQPAEQPQTGQSVKPSTKAGKSFTDNLPKGDVAYTGDTTKSTSSTSNETIKKEADKIQNELQDKRDMGDAGAGGPVASQGESRYCNTMNTLNETEFKQKNKQAISDEVQKIKSRTGRSKFPNASERVTLQALGLDPTSDEAYEYIAAREVFAQQELERIKNIPDSVFYNKKGFAGKDEPYLEWMRAAYDGALSTRKILDEDTNMDMSKPNTTIQSETEVDDRFEMKIEQLLDAAKQSGNQDDINHYTTELVAFKKFRKYHDTYTVGQDSNGRMVVVSISNKKGDDLKDPQNNTTPANRFNIIKGQFGDEVAKTVVKSLDENIEAVSDVKKASIKTSNQVDVDENIVKICELPEMEKYMDKLSGNSKFLKFVANKGLDVNTLSTEQKLKLMQEHSQSLLDSGKRVPYEPYGKIMVKIGEFTQVNKFKDKYPDIDYEASSIKRCIDIKETEKDVVKTAHNQVVQDIRGADEKLGFPKDGKNGPHVQGYIGTVMEAMHFDSYIDGGDGKMIIQMGIRGAQPKDIRACLAEKSGFKGDVSTTEGRESLKKYLRETCKIDAKSGAIVITNDEGTTEICEDTWRTAGTSQKVASGFGSDMRNCISSKVDSRRSSK
jgi:hypothetical protein